MNKNDAGVDRRRVAVATLAAGDLDGTRAGVRLEEHRRGHVSHASFLLGDAS